jgi:hypothetical protein
MTPSRISPIGLKKKAYGWFYVRRSYLSHVTFGAARVAVDVEGLSQFPGVAFVEGDCCDVYAEKNEQYVNNQADQVCASSGCVWTVFQVFQVRRRSFLLFHRHAWLASSNGRGNFSR